MPDELSLFTYEVVSSTNVVARRLIEEGIIEGAACVTARRQTGGRGRGGRRWCSPVGGLWMTQVLIPEISRCRWSLYPLAAGIAAGEAVERIFGVRCDLKWPNDLWWSGRKLGGILCETVREYILIGVGINVQVDRTELRSISDPQPVDVAGAGGAVGEDVDGAVTRLLAGVRSSLWCHHRTLAADPHRLLDVYRRRSLLLGKRVRVRGAAGEFTGWARNVGEDGALLIDCADGTVRRVRAGDVSLRLEGNADE